VDKNYIQSIILSLSTYTLFYCPTINNKFLGVYKIVFIKQDREVHFDQTAIYTLLHNNTL
jgi:hypothetical protein